MSPSLARTPASTPAPSVGVEALTVRYGETVAVDALTTEIPGGSLTAILGPNGCGKSTLLRTVAGILRPASGQVLVGGRAAASYGRKELARTLSMLPQQTPVPLGVTVEELVRRGRHPHHGWLRSAGPGDDEAVESAMTQAGVLALRTRPVAELSGGQRQRAWFAMVLAQETPVVLLDEPTTFLDLAHQYSLLDLCEDLHHEGRTLVAVLHDLGQAARYADHVLLLREGRLVAAGAPREVLTDALVSETYGIACHVDLDGAHGIPVVAPLPRSGNPRQGPARG